MGVTGGAQDASNKLIDTAQEFANEAVDLGEEGLGFVLGTVIKVQETLLAATKTLSDKIVK